MIINGWNYQGDVNLEHGGLFWKEYGADDYVLAVRVTPLSDGGGPENIYIIESGSIYIDTNKKREAIETIGADIDDHARADIVQAFNSYWGIETDESEYVQIGKELEIFGRNDWADITPNTILRANAKLINYIKREYLNN